MSALIAPVRVNPVFVHPDEARLDLSGTWGFRLDPERKGLRERWHESATVFSDPIQVPGCWQGQGFGGDGNDVLWDFRLEARIYRATYRGTGWYGRTFSLPQEWEGRRIQLNFGGAYPTPEVWLNGLRLGENHGPFVPFGFDVTDLVRPGENVLAVRVHELDRELGLSFGWQGNWSGLYRGVELVATEHCFIEDLRLYPSVDDESLRVRASIGGPVRGGTLRLTVRPCGGSARPVTAEFRVRGRSLEGRLPVPAPRLWSPDHPNLYRVDVVLASGQRVLDARSECIGFVKLSCEGRQFLINGEPYYMRGTGEFIASPETGSPDFDRDRWRRKLRTVRDYGYNYVRCQSYVPTPEYLDAADEVGFIVQGEMGMLGAWGGSTVQHIYAWPQPSPLWREKLKWQWDRTVLRDLHHPSANIYCMSNELWGTLFPRTAWRCYRETRALKPGALVIWTDGGFSKDLPGDFVNAEANVVEQTDKTVIQHEFRWWSAFPDVRIMHKYSGAVRPYSAEMAVEAASRYGIAHVLPQAAANSQRLQYLEAKGKMEACRRDNPRIAGISHFTAMDANSSPQGIIDEFFEQKYADAAMWRQTNGDTVVMCSLNFDNRVLAEGDTLRCSLLVSDYSHPPLKKPVLEWRLTAGAKRIASGTIRYAHEPFTTCKAGELAVRIPRVSKPLAARLQVRVREGRRAFANVWDVWLFPARVRLPRSIAVHGRPRHTWLRTLKGVPVARGAALKGGRRPRLVLTERLDGALVDFMRAGGRVLLAASEGLVRPFNPKLGLSVGRYFFTIPANYGPFEDGHDGTIIAEHPMLGGMPHEGFADLQFYRMMGESPSIELESLGLNEGEPVIRVMHSYSICRPLAYLMERRVGQGGVILSALELDQSWPEARYLLAQMCAYATGRAFRPEMELSDEFVEGLMSGTAY